MVRRPDPKEATMESRDLPPVSVVIPTRDRTHLLERAIASVQNQDYRGPIECIVVFDGETPTDPWIGTRADRSIRVLENERTPGPAGARNTGIAGATGELIALLDDDDEWDPRKVTTQAELLAARRDAVVASCGIRVVNRGRSFLRIPGTDTVTHAGLVGSRRSELHTSTLMFRRSDLDRIGLFDEGMPAGYGEDYDWLLRATDVGPISLAPSVLVVVHIGHSYFSRSWDDIAAGVQEQIRRHPELTRNRRNLSRLYGKVAFARAAAHRPREGLRWAVRSIRLDPGQWRAYAAVAIALRLVSGERVMQAVEARGRGL
jgi:glycosyltransferase involved in cell wall biosynthesis